MAIWNSRLDREALTVHEMIRLYCRELHSGGKNLCPDCEELFDYARERLEKCPFGEKKTICRKCPVHCYKRDKKEKIRDVMRYSGPRILGRHPMLTLLHLLDGLRDEPVPCKGKAGR